MRKRRNLPRYHFAIVCNQRSGSHLLASFLDSHPSIQCEGEIGQLHDPLHKRRVDWRMRRGAIIMYNRIGRLEQFRPASVIHLVRDPANNAMSEVINSISRKLLGKTKHRAHRYEGETNIVLPSISPNPVTVRNKTAYIRSMHNRIDAMLRAGSFKYITVHYEDLTANGKNIVECPQQLADTICQFLGIQPAKLTTIFRKSREENDESQHRDRAESKDVDTTPPIKRAVVNFWRKY